jgi:hypothetical protein
LNVQNRPKLNAQKHVDVNAKEKTAEMNAQKHA